MNTKFPHGYSFPDGRFARAGSFEHLYEFLFGTARWNTLRGAGPVNAWRCWHCGGYKKILPGYIYSNCANSECESHKYKE